MSEPRPDVKYMDLTEFRNGGILQEANRLFFHPLGLALEVSVAEGVVTAITGVWDYRDDPEGMFYGEKPDRAKAEAVNAERKRHAWPRIEMMGSVVQSLDWDPASALADFEPHGNPMGESPATE